MSNTIIIVAGGSGSRFKSNIPKQFLELAGTPVLMHSIKTFYDFDHSLQIIVTLPGNQIDFWKDLCKKYNFSIKHTIVAGGKTRFHSVKNALDKIQPTENLVGIHDGVRPLVSKETIKRCFDKAKACGNAVPAIAPVESIRQINGKNNKIIPRDTIRLIQTPQVFRAGLIKKAFKQEYSEIFTDDASVLNAAGEQIHLVEGNRENIKITTGIDLQIAETLLKTMQQV